MSKKYHLFISHSWSYSDEYEKLIKRLDESGLDYADYSVPKDDPIHNAPTTKALSEAIERQISPCSCVLILAGVYATHSKWINEEIRIAKKKNKPIIAIERWGSERSSTVVKNAADEIAKWNSTSIRKAIERTCD